MTLLNTTAWHMHWHRVLHTCQGGFEGGTMVELACIPFGCQVDASSR